MAREINIEVIKVKNMDKKHKNIINKFRVKQWGKNAKKDFNKDYSPDTKFFFVKNNKRVESLGGLRPIKINYLGKEYTIEGICSTISRKKAGGYGRIMVASILVYLKRNKKTGLGFTEYRNGPFFEKTGLKTIPKFIDRFVYVNPETKEKIYDKDGLAIYFEGKDKIITKIQKTKSMVEIPIIHW